MQFLKENRNVFLFLGGLVLLVYFNALGNGFVSDDYGFVNNPAINRWDFFLLPPYLNFSLRQAFHFFTFHIFGLNPFFFRLPNILAHLGSAFLIFVIVRKLSNQLTAIFSATIFAVHPIFIEGVTWISGGGYSFSAFFLLFSFLVYIKKSSKKYIHLSLFLFYISLLSTEKVIVFPLILFTYELAFENLKANWRKIIPFFLLSLTWAILLFGPLKIRMSDVGLTSSPAFQMPNPLIQIPIAITSYLSLIFWPDGLTLYHSEMFFSQAEYLIRLGVFILFLIGIIISFFKNRSVFFWLCFFLISLIPTLTPLGISWIVAERYVYLGTIGIIASVVIILGKSKILRYTLVVIIFFLALRTISRNADWQSHDTLWLATARVSPSSPQNHNNLGDYYGRHGDLKKSVDEFKTAIKINPQYSDAYHNLGNAYRDMGSLDLAIKSYQKALSFNPNLWQSDLNIGLIYYYQKNIPLAEEFFSKAIALNPEVKSLTDKLQTHP